MYTGVLRLAVNWQRRKAGIVLMYHAVNDGGTRFFPALDPAIFAGQVGHLTDYYRVVTLAELAAWLESDQGGPPRALITFDDGYPDTHAVAMPVLKRFSAPATLFLNTEPVECGRRLWMDELSALFAYTGAATFDCPPLGIGVTPLATTGDRWRAREDVGYRLKREGADGFDRVFGHLRENLADAATQEGLPGVLNWAQVKEMQASGFTIGAHTHRHRILSRLSDAEAREEVAMNIGLIRERLGSSVECFAYPNGKADDFTPANRQLLGDLGVRYSVATVQGSVTRGYDPLAMRRLHTGEGSIATFAAWIAGLREILTSS